MAKGPARKKNGQFAKGTSRPGKARSKAKAARTGAGNAAPRKAPKRKPSLPAVAAATGAGKGMSHAKRVKAGKKAARTRARNKAERSRAAKKGAKRRGKKGAGVGAGRGMSHAARSKAAKKAARTRKRNEARELRLKHGKRAKSTGRFGSTRKKGSPSRHKGVATKREVKAWLAHHGHRMVEAHDNPLGLGEYFAAVGGGGVGIFAAYLIDTTLATVPVRAAVAADGVSTPNAQVPTKGTVYNELGPATPIWSAPSGIPWRGIAAVLLILAPTGVSMIPVIKDVAPLMTGLRAVSLGAGLNTLVKLAKDVGAKVLGGTAIGQRWFAAEINAQNSYADVQALAALTPAKMLGPASSNAPQTAVPSPNPYTNSAVGAAGDKKQLNPGAGHAGGVNERRAGSSGCCSNCDMGLPCAQQLPDADAAAKQIAGAAGEKVATKQDQPPKDAPPRQKPNGALNGAKSKPAAIPGFWDSLEGD